MKLKNIFSKIFQLFFSLIKFTFRLMLTIFTAGNYLTYKLTKARYYKNTTKATIKGIEQAIQEQLPSKRIKVAR